MTRKKREAEHENHERWLISYADFITLLFAFFVVMYASSQADKSKAKAVSESVTHAFENASVARRIAEILGGAPDVAGKGSAAMKGPGGSNQKGPAPAKELSESLNSLTMSLKEEISAGKISISMEARGLVISLQQAAFFPSGEDTLLPQAVPTIEKIARVAQQLPNQIRLEGHTDSIPISNERFRSNWELSSARGVTVLQWLESKFGVARTRMAVVAYADTVPKASNEAEEGRALNRRVDITILNEEAAKKEAAGAGIGPKTAITAGGSPRS